MIEFFTSLWVALEANPIIFAIFGSSIIASIIYVCKDLPLKIFYTILDYFSIKLTIFEDNNFEAYRCIDDLFKIKKLIFLTGRFQLWYRWNIKNLQLGCGEDGLFLTKINNTWCLIRKYTDDKVQFWHCFYYEIRLFTRDHSKMEDFFKNIYKTQSLNEDINEFKFYQWFNNSWQQINKRKLSIPYCFSNEKQKIINKITYFLNKEENYINKNIPYKEGFIFYGEPGCGKTHFIQQLASIFNLSIYYFNLSSFDSDNSLLNAIYQIKHPSIMLFEDIDCMQNTNQRNTNSKNEKFKNVIKSLNTNENSEEKKGVTLSTLLNIFDGSLSQDGQLSIITTNYIDKLDEALVRSGRFNSKLEFKKMNNKEIIAYLESYYDTKLKYDCIYDNIFLNISDLNKICLENENVDNVLNIINMRK